jgi:hypothetical protein
MRDRQNLLWWREPAMVVDDASAQYADCVRTMPSTGRNRELGRRRRGTEIREAPLDEVACQCVTRTAILHGARP